MKQELPLTPLQLEVQRQLREFADDPTNERARDILLYVQRNNGEKGLSRTYEVSQLVKEAADGILAGEVPTNKRSWKYFAACLAGTAVETTFGESFDMHKTEGRFQAMTCILDAASRIVEEHQHRFMKEVLKKAIQQGGGLNMMSRGGESPPAPGKDKGFAFNLFRPPVGDA